MLPFSQITLDIHYLSGSRWTKLAKAVTRDLYFTVLFMLHGYDPIIHNIVSIGNYIKYITNFKSLHQMMEFYFNIGILLIVKSLGLSQPPSSLMKSDLEEIFLQH